MPQQREAAIVGIHEYPSRYAPDVSAINIKAHSIKAALDDAGLKWSDIDALYDAQDGEGGGGLGLSAYLGIKPTVFNTTDIHVHVPDGATPKDGPSAGIAMTTAIVSLLTGVPVNHIIFLLGIINPQHLSLHQ